MKNTLLLIITVLCFSCVSNKNIEETEQPNILLIMTDDQAYGDLSMTNNTYVETPVVDQLAKAGAFANHFYVSPVCAPTRASLLTGRYHQRTGVTGVTRGREDMRLDETTMANVFKELGYVTGIYGKWHNGAHYPYHPLGRGFDNFVGFTSGHWSNYFDTTVEKNGKPFKTEGYLVDVLTDEAMQFMEESSDNRQPFFCYLPYQTPHTPLQVPDEYFNKYKNKGLDDFNATIYGMCENVDDNVGRILNKLEELGISNNTIVLYLSDNGPLNYRFNQNLKGRKGMVDEGGTRVPFIINWPGIIKPLTSIDAALGHIDVLPTLLDLVGKEYDFNKVIDGVSFANLLRGETAFPKRMLYNEFFGKERVLADPYLMVNDALFDVRKDPCQKEDIRDENSQIYDSLRGSYNTWFQEVAPVTNVVKAIPVGYSEYPLTYLPAHEATLYPLFEARQDRKHTGIAYHSLYGWAHDWIDFWTNTKAYAQWNIDVVANAYYEIQMEYALLPNNVGAQLQINIGGEAINYTVTEAFEHSQFHNHDRVVREQEAPEVNWKNVTVGKVLLPKGEAELTVHTAKMAGEQSIELKGLYLKKLEE